MLFFFFFCKSWACLNRLVSEFTEKFWTTECLSCCALGISIGCNICHVQRNAMNRRIPFLKMSICSDIEPTNKSLHTHSSLQWLELQISWLCLHQPTVLKWWCCLVLMWMGLNHMVSLSLSLAVLKNLVLSTLAANWSAPIVDSHHHQQVIFPLRAWLLVMYRKSKWKCGYDLAVLGHGEFTSVQLP